MKASANNNGQVASVLSFNGSLAARKWRNNQWRKMAISMKAGSNVMKYHQNGWHQAARQRQMRCQRWHLAMASAWRCQLGYGSYVSARLFCSLA